MNQVRLYLCREKAVIRRNLIQARAVRKALLVPEDNRPGWLSYVDNKIAEMEQELASIEEQLADGNDPELEKL